MINKYENDMFMLCYLFVILLSYLHRGHFIISLYILLSYIVIQLLSYIDLLDLILSFNIIVDHNSDKIN